MERRTSSPPSVVSTVSATEKSSPEVNHIEMNHRVKEKSKCNSWKTCFKSCPRWEFR